MGPESILLQVMRGGREGTYRFDCPTCMEPVEKRADRKIVALLVSAGVDIERSESDQMLFDDEEVESRGVIPQGPVFTIDDVIEFHYLLEDDRYIEEFLASSGGAS